MVKRLNGQLYLVVGPGMSFPAMSVVNSCWVIEAGAERDRLLGRSSYVVTHTGWAFYDAAAFESLVLL